ncbi:ATP-binding protein [Desemzia sp. RIT804]|uniref:AAA family ATPase n=1 Tax=Desemzia sp. RIT 804 TaxID=2810209 RepID=UPI00194F5BCD|nr:ATP-binding protein [Desemzia sp. RIT 804]MBM6614883.1 ATP-binding protein [Desemzia sp. RIT 804]
MKKTYHSISRVVFMCGTAGSGKSTYAKSLEQQGFIRLSFDEESFKRGIRVHPLPTDIYSEIKTFLDGELRSLIAQNKDVVLDYSFWSRQMRDDYKNMLIPFDIKPEIILIDTPKEIVLQRIRDRKGKHPNDIVLDEQTAVRYFEHFQPPTSDEGNVTVIKGY